MYRVAWIMTYAGSFIFYFIPGMIGPFIYFFNSSATIVYLNFATIYSGALGAIWAGLTFVLQIIALSFFYTNVGTNTITPDWFGSVILPVLNFTFYPLIWEFIFPTM